MSRQYKLEAGATELITSECCACGVVFAMPVILNDTLLSMQARRLFYCPNGHGQHYTGKANAEKLAEAQNENADLRRRLERAETAAKKKARKR